ncbi:hypothetical protein JMUB5695_03751 [Mycobacterium heckeshornense]|nr:hypothetical protein JMUB5695_03751 [Mycobacterium heckeshornense]
MRLSTTERFEVSERCERVRRRLPAIEHEVTNRIGREATADELGGKFAHALAEWLLVTRAEAGRRIGEARDLGPRTGLTGEPLQRVLAATAAAQRKGKIGAGGVAVIRRFYHRLPSWVDAPTAERAESKLAGLGSRFRPDQGRAGYVQRHRRATVCGRHAQPGSRRRFTTSPITPNAAPPTSTT